jgi:MraZ protein
MFRARCNAEVTLDPKGRVALPAPIRRALADCGADRLVLTFIDGAVVAYTESDFQTKIEGRVEGQDPFDRDVMAFKHAVIAQAEDVEIDGAGRVRIPPGLRARAGLEKDLHVTSYLGQIEFWDSARWEERLKVAQERFDNRGSGR